ncbi:MAG: Secretion system C-terminal sorting domain [Bacteroidota bacterium]|jgi:5S rRNA maturation endonuclease (ribonuclease M5)
MTTSFFSLLLFFQLLSSTQNNQLSAAYHTQKNPVEDVVVMANPDKKGALLIKGLSESIQEDMILVEIYSLNGKKVKEQSIYKVDGLYELQVDALQEGEYVLNISGDKKKYRSRLIITD